MPPPPDAGAVWHGTHTSTPPAALRLTVGLGGAALTISPLLGWVHVVLLGNLDLFQILRLNGTPSTLVWLGMLAGAAVAVSAMVSSRSDVIRGGGAAVGIVCGFAAVLFLIGAIRAVRQGDGLATVAAGPWMACMACAAMTAGAFYPFRPASLGSPSLPPAFAGQARLPGQMTLSELDDGSRLSELARTVAADGEAELRADEILGILEIDDMSQDARNRAVAMLWNAGLVTYPSIARKGMTRAWRLTVCRHG